MALIALVVLLGMAGTAEAQRRGGRVVVAPRVVVGGGYYYRPYFYDPFWFDPWYGFAYGYQYPWGPYGYPPYRAYRVDPGASVRLEVKPKEAEVYVDGFYAGIVDDFNGTFQRLSVTPGEHEIELWLDGYRTVQQKVYLTPRKTFNVKYSMERLAAGEQPEPRPQPPEPPPGSQAGAPRPAKGRRQCRRSHVQDGPASATPAADAAAGAARPAKRDASRRLRDTGHSCPAADAEVTIDGEKWRRRFAWARRSLAVVPAAAPAAAAAVPRLFARGEPLHRGLHVEGLSAASRTTSGAPCGSRRGTARSRCSPASR